MACRSSKKICGLLHYLSHMLSLIIFVWRSHPQIGRKSASNMLTAVLPSVYWCAASKPWQYSIVQPLPLQLFCHQKSSLFTPGHSAKFYDKNKVIDLNALLMRLVVTTTWKKKGFFLVYEAFRKLWFTSGYIDSRLSWANKRKCINLWNSDDVWHVV